MNRGEPAAAARAATIARVLADAADDKIARIVAMVDALPVRCEADALIAPLRPRISRMKLRRPLNLGRLLFIPIDEVLVHAPQWRVGSPGIPRTALGPLLAVVRAGLGPEAAALNRQLRDTPASDAPAVLARGNSLWPRASAILRGAAAPPEWRASTGLSPDHFATIAAAVAAVLAQASWICAARQAAPPRAGDFAAAADSLADLLCRGAAGEVAAACLIAVLLQTLPEASTRVHAIEGKLDTEARAMLRPQRAKALDFVLERLAAFHDPPGHLAAAADGASRDARLLDELADYTHADFRLRARVQQTRRRADEQYCRRFQEAARSLAAAVAASPDGATTADDAQVTALEGSARALRALAQSARRIRGRDFYDGALKSAAEPLGGADCSRLGGVARVRMTEILVGPDAAMMLLRQMPPGAR